MSVPHVPGAPEPPSALPPGPPPKSGLGGCAMVFLVLLGIVLLLPGLCALIFAVGVPLSRSDMNAVITIGFITFLIAAAGIWLIVYAVRNR